MPPIEGNDEGKKSNIQNTTSYNQIFMHTQSIWNSVFWVKVENLKNDSQYDKIQENEIRFIRHFYPLLTNRFIRVQFIHLEAFQILINIIGLSKFCTCISGFICEYLILLRVFLQILNDKMLKFNN